MTPAVPMAKTRIERRRVIASPGTNTWASGSTKSGTTAMQTPAKPDATEKLRPGQQCKGYKVGKQAHDNRENPNSAAIFGL